MRGVGGIPNVCMGGYPHPATRSPRPLIVTGRGSPLLQSRLTFHAKHTFWDWRHGGVVPCFVQNRRGGRFIEKENRGEGVAKILEGPLHVRNF
jgi:hypothetical protein